MILPLNGGINAGKPCVGEALTRQLAGTAHVEPDDLRHSCSWLPLAAAFGLPRLEGTSP